MYICFKCDDHDDGDDDNNSTVTML
jgi:hypothetical protein